MVLDELSLIMSKVDKSLTVTLLGDKDSHLPLTENNGVLEAVTDNNLFLAAPKSFQPINLALSMASATQN